MAQTHSLDLESSTPQYAYVADVADLDLTGDLTIEAWIKLESQPSSDQFSIVNKWQTTTNDRSYAFVYRDNGGTKSLRFFSCSNGTSATDSFSEVTFSGIVTGVWTSVAVTYDASAGEVEFFVNARSIGTQTGAETSLYNGAAHFVIGASNVQSSPSRVFDGKIKDVRIFDDIRTESEIAADAYTENVSDANLVGEWNFNNSYADSSGNGNTLTASGSPTFATDFPWEKATEISGSTYLETNLVSYWGFDDELTDSTASGNDLTHSGTASYASGILNNGLDLESGSSEYASITDGSQSGLDLSGDWSVTGWINLESLPSANSYSLISKWSSSGSNQAYRVLLLDTGAIQAHVSGDGTSSNRDFWTSTSTSLFSVSTDYHIVISYDVSEREFSVFIDGVEIAGSTTNNGTVSSVHNSNGDFDVGAYNSGASLYFDGIIDELGIYSRFLHYGDVLDLYGDGTPPTYEVQAGGVKNPLFVGGGL